MPSNRFPDVPIVYSASEQVCRPPSSSPAISRQRHTSPTLHRPPPISGARRPSFLASTTSLCLPLWPLVATTTMAVVLRLHCSFISLN